MNFNSLLSNHKELHEPGSELENMVEIEITILERDPEI